VNRLQRPTKASAENYLSIIETVIIVGKDVEAPLYQAIETGRIQTKVIEGRIYIPYYEAVIFRGQCCREGAAVRGDRP